MDQRDKALCMMAGRAVVASIIAALTELAEKDDSRQIDLAGMEQTLRATGQQYLSLSTGSFASFREAQDAQLRLGGADLPPTDLPPLNGKFAEDVGGIPIQLVGGDSEEQEPAAEVENQPVAEIAD